MMKFIRIAEEYGPEIRRAAHNMESLESIRKRLGITYYTMRRVYDRLGPDVADRESFNKERAQSMLRFRERGWTLQRIADKYGMSRQRVHQILNRVNGL